MPLQIHFGPVYDGPFLYNSIAINAFVNAICPYRGLRLLCKHLCAEKMMDNCTYSISRSHQHKNQIRLSILVDSLASAIETMSLRQLHGIINQLYTRADCRYGCPLKHDGILCM